MKRDEELARVYLESLGLGAVHHEPDGNIPPDFVVGSRIAVEVRRLNQNFGDSADYEGLEVGEAAVARYVSGLLPTFGPPTSGQSWFVGFRFRRPLEWKPLKKSIKSALSTFYESPASSNAGFKITKNFEIEFMPASKSHETFFVLGWYNDFDSGGFVVHEVIKNLNICLTEKTAKIKAHRTRYDEWWLVMTDRVSWHLDESDRRSISSHVNIGAWDRVVLIDPRNPTSDPFVIPAKAAQVRVNGR